MEMCHPRTDRRPCPKMACRPGVTCDEICGLFGEAWRNSRRLSDRGQQQKASPCTGNQRGCRWRHVHACRRGFLRLPRGLFACNWSSSGVNLDGHGGRNCSWTQTAAARRPSVSWRRLQWRQDQSLQLGLRRGCCRIRCPRGLRSFAPGAHAGQPPPCRAWLLTWRTARRNRPRAGRTDFFEYFTASLPLLKSDPTLWCVSAWNDNGKDGYVDPGKANLLYRTDFFPGLGWMLLKEVWDELEPKWPASFWDDWMRQPEQRRNRACIRPEISRTLTFGRQGVSLGQFFDKYLRYIKLNTEFVPFTKLDLSYLKEETYREKFEKDVYSAPIVTYEEIKQGQLKGPGPFRLQYSSRDSFKMMAKNLGIMDDLKSGVPRAGYRGVVSFISRGQRIFLAPPPGWTRYDASWS